VILTLNESKNIAECIDTLKSWCEDIVVFDSFSTDNTVEIAKAHGARIFQRKFDNYAGQRNAALHEVDYPGEWVVMVDADERWGREIGERMQAAIADPRYADTAIFHFRRKDIFLGRWLKHNIGTSTWFGRLLKHRMVSVVREINEEYHCVGEKTYLEGERFLHYPFNNGVNWWFARHNRYSDMEAVCLLEERSQKLDWKVLRGGDPVARRKMLKLLLYRIPGRPLWVFTILYFLKGGFLDGKAGFHYSLLRSIYEYMIDLKVVERKFRDRTTGCQ